MVYTGYNYPWLWSRNSRLEWWCGKCGDDVSPHAGQRATQGRARNLHLMYRKNVNKFHFGKHVLQGLFLENAQAFARVCFTHVMGQI